MRVVWWLGLCALVAVGSGAREGASRPSFCDDGPTHTRPGACFNQEATYTYDTTTNRCREVPHGGCLAADNVFETEEECQRTCVILKTRPSFCDDHTTVARLGACFNQDVTYTYNPTTNQCVEVAYGGCLAADNVFETEDECQGTCVVSENNDNNEKERPDFCNVPREARGRTSCFNREKSWTFYPDTERCEEIPTGGCLSADSVFESEEECQSTCAAGNTNTNNKRPAFCEVPRDARGRNSCFNRQKTWSFYPDTERCEEIPYGGCTAADNVFETEEECNNACPTEPDNPFNAARDCLLMPVVGRCRARKIRYYYNDASRTCERFRYGGCGGNTNNFLTKDDCDASCTHVLNPPDNQNPCSLRQDPGPCEALFQRFYYDSATGQCRRFTYGGCQGNANNFETEDECRRTCPSAGK